MLCQWDVHSRGGRNGSTQGTWGGLSLTGTGKDPHATQGFQQCLEWPQQHQSQLSGAPGIFSLRPLSTHTTLLSQPAGRLRGRVGPGPSPYRAEERGGDRQPAHTMQE